AECARSYKRPSRGQRIVSRVISGQEETSQVGIETAFYGLPIRLFLNLGRKFFDTSKRALRVVGFWDWTGRHLSPRPHPSEVALTRRRGLHGRRADGDRPRAPPGRTLQPATCRSSAWGCAAPPRGPPPSATVRCRALPSRSLPPQIAMCVEY